MIDILDMLIIKSYEIFFCLYVSLKASFEANKCRNTIYFILTKHHSNKRIRYAVPDI